MLVVGVLVTGCGSGTTPLQTVRSSANETAGVRTAQMSATIKSESGPLAKGLSYNGAFDFSAHRGRFQLDPSALGIKASVGTIDAVFDFSNGLIVYVTYPQVSQVIPGKSWIKVDVGAVTAATTGVNVNSLFLGGGSDPTSGMRLLAGAAQVTRVGTETVRGTPTTHFHVIVDVDKAAAAAPPQAREAMQKLAALYIVKSLPLDVWLDGQGRMRRYQQVMKPADLKFPAQSQAAVNAAVPISINIELFDFGGPVDVTLPPADQVADLAQLQRGASSPATPSGSPPPSPAKAAYISRANAICTVMNHQTGALGDPGNDPQQQATVTSQSAAIASDALRQLRALPAPPGDATALNAIFAKVDVVVADATKLAAALRAGDQSKAQTLEATLQADTRAANDAANAYGLTVCGS